MREWIGLRGEGRRTLALHLLLQESFSCQNPRKENPIRLMERENKRAIFPLPPSSLIESGKIHSGRVRNLRMIRVVLPTVKNIPLLLFYYSNAAHKLRGLDSKHGPLNPAQYSKSSFLFCFFPLFLLVDYSPWWDGGGLDSFDKHEPWRALELTTACSQFCGQPFNFRQ